MISLSSQLRHSSPVIVIGHTARCDGVKCCNLFCSNRIIKVLCFAVMIAKPSLPKNGGPPLWGDRI